MSALLPDPFPLNNGTHLAAKRYDLNAGRVGSIFSTRQEPLDPTGQVRRDVSRRLVLQSIKTPKQSFQKAFSCGDHFEVSEYFDAKMQPAMYLYDYSKKPHFDTSELKNELETEAETQERIRQELLTEGWPIEKVNALYAEPEPEETEEEEEISSANAEENRARSLRRAQNNARRIIQANRFDMMWTFTFSERSDWLEWADKKFFGITRYLELEKQKDRKEVNKAWGNFQKRLKRYCKKQGIEYRWLKVLEIHDGKDTRFQKRGTYHIHVASNLRMSKKTLQALWGFGIVHFTDFTKEIYSERDKEEHGPEDKTLDTNYSKDPSFYMCKYIDKDFDEARERKEKAFSKSQNIQTPKPDKDHETIEEKKADPLKAFELSNMCREIREALESAKMEELLLSDNIYPIAYQKWNSDAQEFQTVKGFVRKTYYSACLAIPKYKQRYERFLEKKRIAAEKESQEADRNRQLSLF